MTNLLQYLGASLGVTGSFLVTSPSRRTRLAAFALWVASNGCLIAYFATISAWGLIAMSSVYTATSLLGLWRNRRDAS